MKTSTLRPGLLVSLKTTLVGNVQYAKQVIESEHTTKEGKAKAKWETERTIHDPIEHEAGVKARGKARSTITAVCSNSAFGLLCPETDSDKLEQAIAEARTIAEEFNATAALSRITVYVITGRIAQDDVEAMRAINSEVRDLLSQMQDGVKNLDVAVIREAANKAKNIGNMLTPDAQVRMQFAIDAARKAAREIVKAGEGASIEVDKTVIRKITEARTAFLDFDGESEIKAPVAEGRAVDLEPATNAKPARVERVRALDIN